VQPETNHMHTNQQQPEGMGIMLQLIKSLFKKDHRTFEQREIEAWLSKSSDLADLERRQQQLSRGTSPMQINAARIARSAR
jgi:hypothetical protein